MATLTVGSGQTYTTIASAVAAAQSSDIINVEAGTYTNDFVGIYKNLTLNAVGGLVTMAATVSAPNGKAILDEGGAGITVTINGFAFTGATVSDGNGAGVRYEGGTLNITQSHFYGNQDGLLANSDPAGAISISSSEFDHNGAGDGYTHNIYINDIQSFSLTNSYIHDANVGHEVKSRAENNTITNNRILDNNSTSSYELDLPNGGNAVISGNTIQQGPESQNPNIIAYGEEGNLHSGTSLLVTGNTIVNDLNKGPALWNASSATATFSNNSVYGFGANALVSGPASQSGTIVLGARPTLDQSASNSIATALSGLILNVAEDAWQGDAMFTITIDGNQVGGTATATALQNAGATQQIALGSLSVGQHQIGISFINDAYGGSATTDRNLYLDGATYNGVALPGTSATLLSNGTATFVATGDQPATGLAVNVAEDAWQGDAQFTISVDGTQVGGVQSATASHTAGQSQTFSVGTTLTTGRHNIGITFINDAYGGSASTDRNLYVTGLTYNGEALGNATSTLLANGTSTFSVVAGQNLLSTATINVSEDAYLGDAQFTVTVDGNQEGTYTATALHNAGQSQAITKNGITEGFTPHDIAVTFLNDAYAGTPSTDRNLYVNSIQFDNQTVAGASASLFAAGTKHFTAVAPANWTG